MSIYSFEPKINIDVEIQDKKLFEKMREEDLVLFTKSEKNLDWKSLQDELDYLREDFAYSEDFDISFDGIDGEVVVEFTTVKDAKVVATYFIRSSIEEL